MDIAVLILSWLSPVSGHPSGSNSEPLEQELVNVGMRSDGRLGETSPANVAVLLEHLGEFRFRCVELGRRLAPADGRLWISRRACCCLSLSPLRSAWCGAPPVRAAPMLLLGELWPAVLFEIFVAVG